MYVLKYKTKSMRERERCTLVDEVWEVLLIGKIQGMDSLELYDIIIVCIEGAL